MNATTANAFLLPSQVKPVGGSDLTRQMYPYFTGFRPGDDGRFWFYNKMHFPEPMPAFDAITAEAAYASLGVVTTRMFAIPTSKGIEHRIVNGRIYISANLVTDPEEIGRRVPAFEDRAFFYFGNWDRLYKDWHERMMALIKRVDAITVPRLDELDNADDVKSGRGYSNAQLLLTAYDQTIEDYFMMWQYHSEFLVLGYGAYLTFFNFCKTAFPEIEDRTIANMVAGVDALMFRPDDELKRLARRAVELDLDQHLSGSPQAAIEALKGAGKPGADWLADLEQVRDPWFNTSVGDGFYHHHRRWNDDLRVPFAAMADYAVQIRKGKNLERPTKELKLQRDRITTELRALLKTDADRATFDQMLGLSHTVFPYVEDHKFYCEHWLTGSFFNKVREFGGLLKTHGMLDDAEDIFQLNRAEIREALSDLRLAWSVGGETGGAILWRETVSARKQLLAEYVKWDAPLALGPVPETIEHPMFVMLWGVTPDTIRSWQGQSESDSEISGFGASPGTVEGIARVIQTVEEIERLEEGDILVCPITAPSWAPVFGKIRAAVSDIGGTMSHAAIVAREYGLPAVVGTGSGTKRIKDGQRIRVDGNSGRVTILA